MKQVKRLLSLVIALTMAFGIFAFSAQAKGKAAPVSLKVQTSSAETGYTGVITVTVTVKNTSGKDVRNIVITSCGSTGLCMYRPIDYNVVITNPGYSKPLTKKDAVTTCLKPGGTIKYVYCVLLGYQYAKRLVPEATRNAMLHQHKLLKTKNFREISIKANYLESCRALCFGDVKTALDVKAYYNVGNSTYDKIAAGSSVYQNAAVRTSGNNDSAASGGSSRTATSSTSSSENSSSSSSGVKKNYIVDTKSKHYHTHDCGHLPDENYDEIYASVEELMKMGYTLCGHCARS